METPTNFSELNPLLETTTLPTDQRKAGDSLSSIQFGLSLVGAMIFLVMTGFFILVGIISQFTHVTEVGGITSFFLMASSLGFMGASLLIAAILAWMRLSGKRFAWMQSQSWGWLRHSTLLILFLPFIFAAGFWVSERTRIAWLILPFLNLLAIASPLFWFVHLAKRNLPSGSPQRNWGALTSGMVLAPPLIFLIEITLLVILFGIVVVYIVGRADVETEFSTLMQRLANAPPNLAVYRRILGPIIMRPSVAFFILGLGAVIIPLVEELIKPIGMWLLVGRKVNPAAGFVVGLFSGAGFAISESLLLTTGGESWLLLVVTRLGTGLMHVFTGGLVGWGLAVAWKKGRYARLGLAYLAAVLIHGLWNGLTLLAISQQFIERQSDKLTFILSLVQVAPLGLGLFCGGIFFLLLYANKALHKKSHHQLASS